MKRLFLIGLIVLVSMANVFGEEIPWGVSEEEVDAKYSWLYEFMYSETFGIDMEDISIEHFNMGFNTYSAWPVAKDGLFGLSYILFRKNSKGLSDQLDYFEERLDELDEMYGKSKIGYFDEGSVEYVWTTDRESISIHIYSGVIFVGINVPRE